MIAKIVTARQTEYAAGSFVLGKGLEVTIASIESVFGNSVDETVYVVNLSDGSYIEVKDVVEAWRENDS